MLAAQGIASGDIDVAVAGGMESMSNARTCCRACAKACAWATAQLVDSMINDGLWCAFEQCHMGHSGEVVAEHYHVGPRAQDEYAARSHQKAAGATDAGWFRDEILPIAIPQRKGAPRRDRSRRGDPRATPRSRRSPR